jgi:archaellum component FlaF (FlaF/FlaG flagellin family)
MRGLFYFIFCFIVVSVLFSQSTETVNHDIDHDHEKCAKVVYHEDNTELIITNPVETEYIVQIYNLTGIVVMQVENVKPETSKINVSELNKGIYLVKITPVPNLHSATFKVVIR